MSNSAFWDERFGGVEYAYGREPNEFLRAEAHRIPKGRVLCLAEGEGRNAVFLAGLGHDVTAVDFSKEGIKKTQQLAAERGVRVTSIEADLAAFAIDEAAFTGIVAIFAHLAKDVRTRVHAAVVEGLVPGGCYVLEAYTPRQLAFGTGGPKNVELLMEPGDVKRELAALDLVVAREVEREINEGSLHHGKSATLQIVGLKR